MGQGSRPERIGDLIRSEVAHLLAREVKDPGIGFITVTAVRVTSDLHLARVYYTMLGDDRARKDTARALERAGPFLRRAIGQRLRLRRAPEITFIYDESIERQDRIERLLQDLRTSHGHEESHDGGSEPED